MESVARSVNNNKKELIGVNSKLQELNNVSEIQEAKTLNSNGYAQVLLTSAGGTAVKADTTCVVQQDPEHREGWNLTNSAPGTKFNLYYFNGTQETITLGDVLSIYFKGFINNNSETASIPFFHIYTKPTGSGDAGPWYHSKIDYEYASDNTIGIGEECIFYGGEVPKTKFNNRQIAFNNKTVTGEGLDSEEVLYLVVSSNTGATQDAVNVTINLMGFNTDTIFRNFKMLSESSLTGAATEAKQDDMITKLTSIDGKLIRGDDENRADALEVSLYARHPTSADLGLLHMTAGHNLKVSIEEQNGSADLATETKQDLQITELQAINTGVGSIDDKITVGNDDTLSQAPQCLVYGRKDASPSGLRAMEVDNEGQVFTRNSSITNGSELTLSSVQQVGTYAWDGSNFRRIVANDVLNSLLVSNIKEVPVTSTETIGVLAGGTGLSSAIDLAGYSLLTIQGNSTNTTDMIELLTSIDNVTYRKDGTFLIQQDLTTGDYSVSLDRIATRYVKIRQIDTVATAFTMVVETSRR